MDYERRIRELTQRLEELEYGYRQQKTDIETLRTELQQLHAEHLNEAPAAFNALRTELGELQEERTDAVLPSLEASHNDTVENTHIESPTILTKSQAREVRQTGSMMPRDQQSNRNWEWETLIGSKLLPYAGAILVAVGLCFLMAIAAQRGYFPLEARLVLGSLASVASIIGGIWLARRDGVTRVPLGLAGAGLVGLFASVIAAQATDTIAISIALVISLIVGGGSLALSRVWHHPLVGGVGVFGGLIAPLLVGVDVTTVALGWYGLSLAIFGGMLGIERRWWSLTGLATIALIYPAIVLWSHNWLPLFVAMVLIPTALGVVAWYWNNGHSVGREWETRVWVALASLISCYGVWVDVIGPPVAVMLCVALVLIWYRAPWVRMIPVVVGIGMLDVSLSSLSPTGMLWSWLMVAIIIIGSGWLCERWLIRGEMHAAKILWIAQLAINVINIGYSDGSMPFISGLVVGTLLLGSPLLWPQLDYMPDDMQLRSFIEGCLAWAGLGVLVGMAAWHGGEDITSWVHDAPIIVGVAVAVWLATQSAAHIDKTIYIPLAITSAVWAAGSVVLIEPNLISIDYAQQTTLPTSKRGEIGFEHIALALTIVAALWSSRLVKTPPSVKTTAMSLGFAVVAYGLFAILTVEQATAAIVFSGAAAVWSPLLGDRSTRMTVAWGTLIVAACALVLDNQLEAVVQPIENSFFLILTLAIAVAVAWANRTLFNSASWLWVAIAGIWLAVVEVAVAGEIFGQMLISISIAAIGAALMFSSHAATLINRAEPGKYGLALLVIAAIKVIAYDFQTLDAFARVGSSIVSGLLLLAAAWLYAREQAAETRDAHSENVSPADHKMTERTADS